MDALTFLRERVALFAGVDDAPLSALAAVSSLQTYANGQTVTFKGATVDGLHVVASGAVGVYVKVPGKGPVQVAQLASGEVFGEASIVEPGTAGATVKATQDGTLVLLIPQEAFRRLLVENPTFEARVRALIASRRPAPPPVAA